MTKHLTTFILLSGVGVTQAANVYNITASAGLMLDDNITRAQYERDIYDDRAWFVGVSGDYALPVTDRSRTQFTATIESWLYQDTNLGHEIISLQADYIFQPGSGYTAPWYSLHVLLGLNIHDNEYRDGHFNELGLTMGKRLTDATSLRAGISRQQTSTDDKYFTQNSAQTYSNFSLASTRIYGNLDFKLGENTVYSTLAYSTGDILSTNTPPHPATLANTPWINEDAVFPGLTNSWTYKLDADTWSLRLGYVYALASNQSLDANIMRYQSSAYGGNDYDGMIASIAYFYRF